MIADPEPQKSVRSFQSESAMVQSDPRRPVKYEERFHPASCAGWSRGLSAQADRIAGEMRKKKSACCVRNDGRGNDRKDGRRKVLP